MGIRSCLCLILVQLLFRECQIPGEQGDGKEFCWRGQVPLMGFNSKIHGGGEYTQQDIPQSAWRLSEATALSQTLQPCSSLAVSLELVNAKFVLLNTVLVTPSSCALYMMSEGHLTRTDLNMTSEPFSKHVTNARCYHWPREHIPPRTLLISQMDFMG